MTDNTIKAKRAHAKIIMRYDPYVYNMVDHITKTGQCDGRTTLTWLKDTMLEQGIVANPPIKVQDWVQAKELSEYFRTVNDYKPLTDGEALVHTNAALPAQPRKKGKKGRPAHNFANHQIGALTVLRQTGYVSIKPPNSPVWICECMCGRQVAMNSHELRYNLPYCNKGKASCEYGHERAKDWRAGNNKPFKLGAVAPTTTDTADMLINNITGAVSTEIH